MNSERHIIDTTLREGEQSPGVLFSITDKKRIVDGLVKIGIHEAEVGIASHLHPDTRDLIDYSRAKHPHLKLSLWSRCIQKDIVHAIKQQPDIISLSIPVSNIHLHDRLHKDRDWAKAAMQRSIRIVQKHGIAVSVGFEDATRCDPDFLTDMVQCAEKCGAMRIRIADTVGISSPGEIIHLVKSLKKQLNHCVVGIHAHNDFGMATANSVAALEAGASSVDVVVLGLGERTGCARLEEVVGYLSLAKGHKRFKPRHLKPLAQYVATITKRPISNTRPVIGEGIFTCETGLHLQGLQQNPKSYEPFNPERIQAKRKLLYGCKSGRNALIYRCNQISPTPIENIDDQLIGRIRYTAKQLQRPLHDDELLQLLTPKPQ